MNNLKQWVVNLDYQSKSEPTRSGGHRYEQVIQEFFGMVARLAEGMTFRFEGIDPATLEIKVKTDDGGVPLEAVSQGTASLVGWIGSLVQRMYEVYGYEVNPTEQYALVLIDEIDAHMHPCWQQSVVPALAKLFPNVQFVATTHSPLIAGSRESREVFRLRRDEGRHEQVIVERIEESFRGWRADQILTTLFGLHSTRDPETQKLLARYTELATRDDLSPDEQLELERIAEILKIRLPSPAERREAREASRMIQQAMREQWNAMPSEERQQILQEMEAQLQEVITGSRRPR